jgi:membrane protein implicated in regulation of membrane protease activity
MSPRDETPTTGEMLAEVFDLITGLGVMLLPALILAIPCFILLLPLLILPLPLVLLAAPFVLVRMLWRRRPPRAGRTPPARVSATARTA